MDTEETRNTESREGSFLKKIYENVFPEEKLSEETKTAIKRVVHYLFDDNGPGNYLDSAERKKKFMSALNEAAANYLGKNVETIMSGAKTNENVMLRNICFAIYLDNFPMASSSEIARAFSSKKDSSTIRINLIRFRSGYKLHDNTKKIYTELTDKVQEILNNTDDGQQGL